MDDRVHGPYKNNKDSTDVTDYNPLQNVKIFFNFIKIETHEQPPGRRFSALFKIHAIPLIT